MIWILLGWIVLGVMTLSALKGPMWWVDFCGPMVLGGAGGLLIGYGIIQLLY